MNGAGEIKMNWMIETSARGMINSKCENERKREREWDYCDYMVDW